MPPLVPLALEAAPELTAVLAADHSGVLTARVIGAVQAVTGTADPVQAQKRLARSAALAAALRLRLTAIAQDAAKSAARAVERKRRAKGPDRRATRVVPHAPPTPASWGAPAVSVLVTIGFFVLLIVLITGGIRTTPGDTTVLNIVNIAVGALATAFATVVNFWLGSSQGSRRKDETVTRLQAAALERDRAPRKRRCRES